MDQGGVVGAVYLDLKKDFDNRVNHEVLISYQIIISNER